MLRIRPLLFNTNIITGPATIINARLAQTRRLSNHFFVNRKTEPATLCGGMSKSPKRGRPPKGAEAMMEPITVRFPPAMMREIEEIQTTRMDAPDKGQVVRELIAQALADRKQRGKR